MTAVTRVLGVDSSLSKTGLCITGGAGPKLGLSKTKTGAPGTGAKLDRMLIQADVVTALAEQAELVVIEGLSFASTGSATRDLAGLWWLLVHHLRDLGAEIAVAPPGVLKKWVTGAGNASKFQVGQHIAKRWPELVLDHDDQADALACASMGLHHAGVLPWTPTAYQREQVTRLEWVAARPGHVHTIPAGLVAP